MLPIIPNQYLKFTAFFLAFSIHTSLNADIVKLKNGKSFEGIIKKENSTEVTINIGLGTISFNKNQVATIERSESTTLQGQWQKQYFSKGKYVPPGLNQLADAFNTLESNRKLAAKAKNKNSLLQRRRTKLFKDLTNIKSDMAVIAQHLQQIVPADNVDRYNNLVKKQNELFSRSVIIKNGLQDDTEEASALRESIANYLQHLANFKTQLETEKKQYATPPADEQVAYFFSTIDQHVRDYSTEFQDIEVPHDGNQGHMILTVRLNDKIDGQFLLDTGATFVTLSNSMARRLQINLSSQNQIPVSLANGSQVNAQPVILKSVQVGDARVNGVAAMIFPEAPNDGVDGLLGMSFLREFMISMDPTHKKLIFQKFNPK